MKTLTITLVALAMVMVAPLSAQTAEEIIDTYFENTGGIDAWNEINSLKATGKAGMGPQEFDFTQYAMADGRMAIAIDLQGQQLVPQAFDGETVWGTNFQSMKAEAQDSETSTNYKKNEANDIIDPFLNYQEKGYSIEKLEDDTKEGVDVFTIKLIKNPIMVEGKEEAVHSIYYFDKENFVPVVSEATIMTGPQKGMKTQTIYSDYLEAGDVYMAHSITNMFNGQPGQTIKVDTIEINPDIDESIFEMPTE